MNEKLKKEHGMSMRCKSFLLTVVAVLVCAFSASESTASGLSNAKNYATIDKPNSASQQQSVITGSVVDEKGMAMPGVTVKIKGTLVGTSTDADGKFQIAVNPSQNVVLVFSFVGMKSQEVDCSGKTNVRVVMKEDAAEIEEVVVNGYFARKKEGFAGTITTVSKSDLQKLSTGNIFTTLSSIDSGFKINEDNLNGSNPNVIPDFTIRGKGSFQNGSTSPIFILDGFEVSAEKVFDMDVNRIASITLLKDASATILYGSRAANGVIVIETDQPKTGELRLTYDFKPTIAYADLTGYDLMNAQEKLEYEKLAGLYDLNGDVTHDAPLQTTYMNKYKNVLEGVDTYWLSQPLHNAFSQSHSLYVEGGVNQVRYGIDASYNGQKGVMKESGRDRVGLGFSLIYRIKDKVTIKNYISYAYTHAYNSPYGDYSQYGLLNPYEKIKDENGDLIPQLIDGSSVNPLYDSQLPNRNFTNSEEFREQLSVDYRFYENFRLRGQVGVLKGNSSSEKYISPFSSTYLLPTTWNPTTGLQDHIAIKDRGELDMGKNNNIELSSNITLNYNTVFNEKHVLYAGLGWEVKTSKTTGDSYQTTGFTDDRYSDPSFAMQYKEGTKPASSESKYRTLGFLGNVNYIYDNRYFADFSARYDGSSKFGADKRWAPFWSVGCGWNIHKEAFWSIEQINMFKLRYSYGVTGNQEFEAYQAKTMYAYNTVRPYNSTMTASLLGFGNPNLKWQNKYQHNIGLDFGAFKDRLRMTFNYYSTNTDGVLTTVTVAPSIGLPNNSYTSNLGKIQNKGVELNLNGVIINKPEQDFQWAVALQMSHNKNKLVEISQSLKTINDANNLDKIVPGKVYEEGQSMTAIKAVKSLGIDPLTGKELYVKKDGSVTYDWNADDKILCGDTEPKVYGNISTNVYYKGFNLNAVFKYEFGGDYYNQTLASRVEGANPSYNADRRVLNDRWTKPGDNALYKNISDYTTTYVSTRFVQKQQLLQMTNLSLSYDFAKDKIKKYKLQTLRLSFYMNDLFRASTIKDERGLSYPFQRSFVFGLNVGI